MRLNIPHKNWCRRGAVAVLVAVAAIPLLIALAVAIDGGLLFAEKRHAQATADAAALAGAADLLKNWQTNKGKDPGGTASAAASAVATANGYTGSGLSTVVAHSADNTYLGGPNAGNNIAAGYIEVTVTYNHPRYFSMVLATTPIPIKARAVAMTYYGPVTLGVGGGGFTMLSLASTGVGLNVGGNGTINDTDGSIMVNSSAANAIEVQGNSSVTAVSVDTTGGIKTGGMITTVPDAGNINTGVSAVADPLASLPVPTGLTPGDMKKLIGKEATAMLQDLVTKKTIDQTYANTKPNVYVATPGTLNSIKNLNQNDLVVFQQASANSNGGIYSITSGGLFSVGAGMVMDPNTSGGIMLYNAGTGKSQDKIDITGYPGRPVEISGLTSGLYQGLTIFQNPASEAPLKLEGNGTLVTNGMIYAAGAEVKLAGNGTTSSSGVISKTIDLTGNGILNVMFNAGGEGKLPFPNAARIRLVE